MPPPCNSAGSAAVGHGIYRAFDRFVPPLLLFSSPALLAGAIGASERLIAIVATFDEGRRAIAVVVRQLGRIDWYTTVVERVAGLLRSFKFPLAPPHFEYARLVLATDHHVLRAQLRCRNSAEESANARCCAAAGTLARWHTCHLSYTSCVPGWHAMKRGICNQLIGISFAAHSSGVFGRYCCCFQKIVILWDS